MDLVIQLLVVVLFVRHGLRVNAALRRLRTEVDALNGSLEQLRQTGSLAPAEASQMEAYPLASWSSVPSTSPQPAAVPGQAEPPPPEERPEPAWIRHGPAALSSEMPEPEPALGQPTQAAVAHAAIAGGGHADDVEIRLGTIWTLRIGLAAIAIAAALFARTIVPDLAPAAKVALAYAGAWLLFATGRYFEARLERFARPVMAGGLALAFFVSFAAHFVPAMQAVPLAASLVWMAAGTAMVLFFATRWGSQATAALAIFLGHVTAFVAAGDAAGASLVVIVFLVLTAVVLLLRNGWVPLSLFAIVAANGTHLLWALAAQGAMPRPTFMALNLIFLSSYYLIFLAADLLWWRNRGASTVAFQAGRAFGPVNLVLYVAVAWWLLSQGTATPALTAAFFFAMAALQGIVAVTVRRFDGPDDAVYLVAGTALLTIGLFAAFDALALDLLLAALAFVLLMVAHRLRRRVFHLLAQAALAISFLQYVVVAAAPGGGAAALLGGLAIAAAYLAMSQLEAVWFERERLPWGAPTPALRTLQGGWDALFQRAAPTLPSLHAVAGALVLLRTFHVHLSPEAAAAATSAALVALTVVAIARRSLPLSLAWLVAQVGVLAFANVDAPPAGVGPILAAIGLGAPLLLAQRSARRDDPFGRAGPWIATVGLWLAAAVLPPLIEASTVGAASIPTYLTWIVIVGLVFAFAARAGFGGANGDWLHGVGAPLTAGAGTLLVLFVTHQLLGPMAAAPVWTSAWGLLLAVAAWRRRDAVLEFGALLLVASTAPLFLVALGLGPAVAALFWASAAVIGVPLLLALAWDRSVPAAASPSWIPYALYALAGLTWWYVVLERTAYPWTATWMMLLPIGLLLVALRVTLPRATWVALALTGAAALGQLAALAEGADATLWATALIVAAVVAVERLTTHYIVAARGSTRWIAIALIGTSAALALMAVLVAAEFGAAWRTAGWSLVAGTVLTLGFVWRSAAYRRVGLVAFALSLVRVFLVDVQSLPTGAQTLAFLALGVSLVAVAWLYARFAGEIRQWL